MFAKLMMGAAAVLAAALFAYLGDRLITAYGEARYQSGLAEGQLKQLPGVLAADAKAAQAGLDARDRVIAADGARDATLARLIPQILSAQDKVTAYAESAAGRVTCLGPERVRGIEDDRAVLFPATGPNAARDRAAGSMPTDAAPGAGGS
jgi:hypothetical protein